MQCLKKSTNKKGATSSDSSEEYEVQDSLEKRKRARNIIEIGEPKKRRKVKEKDIKVQATIDQLTEKHGDKSYTPMQYCVLAEMYIGGVHTSLDNPPTSTMYNRAGGGGSVKSRMCQTFDISAIRSLISALTPQATFQAVIVPQVALPND